MDVNFTNLNLDRFERQQFLKIWNQEYPLSLGVGFSGMIVFLKDQVWLERGGEKVKNLVMDTAAFFENSAKGHLQNISPLSVLCSGDWVECVGRETSSTVQVEWIRLLSPNLTGKEHRSEVKTVIRDWRDFIKSINAFFDQRGFDFINTPTLVLCPGTEPFLEPFSTEFIYGSKTMKMFLPTSPELHLKKCLAKGWDKIYEIRPCFRNGEISSLHQPEFHLLEWYRAFASTLDIQEDLKELVSFLAPPFKSKVWARVSMAELFQKYLDFELTPSTSQNELVELARHHEIDVTAAVDFDEVFYYLFLEKIEPRLKEWECLFLHSYPPSQAALARLTPEGWGDRFELYIQGIEIANAFCELNNPVEQRARSLEDLDKKQTYGKTPVMLDEDFFLHLDRGMPPSSGIALGVDRLFMVLMGYSCLTDFRLFPLLSDSKT